MQLKLSGRKWHYVVVAHVLLILLSTSTSAQPAKRALPTANVTIIRVENVGQDGASVAIVRRTRTPRVNAILVQAGASAQELAVAIDRLVSQRRKDGDLPQREMRAFITANSAAARGLPADRTARAAAILRRLTSAGRVTIEGLPSGNGIHMELPTTR